MCKNVCARYYVVLILINVNGGQKRIAKYYVMDGVYGYLESIAINRKIVLNKWKQYRTFHYFKQTKPRILYRLNLFSIIYFTFQKKILFKF